MLWKVHCKALWGLCYWSFRDFWVIAFIRPPMGFLDDVVNIELLGRSDHCLLRLSHFRILLVIFIWIYSGFTSISLTLDNSNIGFNLPIIILFPIINWIAESETKSNQYIYMFILLFFLLLLCFLLNSLIIPFICYEYLIILLFFILFIFIPSFYRIRTAFFSFLFSILGSINFILSLFYIISPISLFSLLI